MNRLCKKLLSFLSYCAVLSIVLAAAYAVYFRITPSDIPAVNLSDSYSLNEKMEFLRKSGKGARIIANGSSMTLNNLYSKTIVQRLHSEAYLNTASWGMSMKDNFLTLGELTKTYHPSTLIITSNLIDFQQPDKNVKYSSLNDFLHAGNLLSAFYHLGNFNLQYYVTYFRYAKKIRSNNNGYEYLGFDKYGAVNYDSANFEKEHERWNEDMIGRKIAPYQYAYLDSISNFCKSNNIRLLFFHSPLRKGLYSQINKEKLDDLQEHISKVQAILTRGNHVFINANDTKWDDRLFVDAMHFNTEGAKIFTEYCFDKVQGIL